MAKAINSIPPHIGGSVEKNLSVNAGDMGSILGLGRSPGEGKGYLLQYSGLENSMDYILHGVAKSGTKLSNFHFHLNRRYFGFVIITDTCFLVAFIFAF